MRNIPYGKQSIEADDIQEVVKVLKSDFLTTGPKVQELEDKFSKYVGSKYTVTVSSGTAALHLACLAAGLKKDDELITSPLTFVATANCALYCQAKPVFVDINDQGLIDEDKISKKITKKTKIIIPVHYSGLPCNLKAIKKIANKHKLIIIEDVSHALGARYKKSKIGDCQYSDMAVFSLHPIKHVTTGEGGVITTNSKKFYEKLVMLRNHGITKNSSKLIGPWYYEMQDLGFNYRLTDLQCALGISQLKKLNKFIAKRRKIAKKYDQAFQRIEQIEVIKENKNQLNSYHLYPIRVKNQKIRLHLFKHLQKNRIFCQVHYIPVYWHPYYQKLGFKKGLCPKAEEFYKRVVSIPIFPKIKPKEQEYIIKNIIKFFSSHQVKNFKIQGKRIYLKKLDENKATKEYCRWLNDPEVNKYLETKKATIESLKKYIREKNNKTDCLFLGIFIKENNKHVGNIKLEPIDFKKKEAILGIMVGDKNYWGKGIGTEAIKLITDYAFKNMNLNKFNLKVNSKNTAAVKAYKKAGFKAVKIKKDSKNQDGKTCGRIKMRLKISK